MNRHAVSLLIALLLAVLVDLGMTVEAAGLAGIPGPEQPYSAQPTSLNRAEADPEPGYLYTVQPGDDIWIIALAHGIPMQALVEANDLAGPYIIHPGDKLWVPAAPATVSEQLRQAQIPTPTPRPTARPPAGTPSASTPPAMNPAQPTPSAKTGAQSTITPGTGDWASLLLSLINQKRTQHGLPALAWSPELAAAAQAHAEDLARRGRGSHIGSDGARLRERLARVGYDAGWAGENWANYATPQIAFAMWWDEPPGADPHRQNILGRGYRQVGIGIAKGGYSYFFVADFASR